MTGGLERRDARVQILRAYDGQQALDTLLSQPVDVMLLDLAMPEVDGFTVLEELRNQEMNVPVILLTATQHTEHESEQQGDFVLRRLGGFTPNEVLYCIKAILSGIKSSPMVSILEEDAMLPFNEQLHSTNKPLVLDGAMGTELARRGVDTSQEEWSAAALETAPDVVRQVHIDYIRAGADIITTNTFRTHARSLQSSARAREWTHKAVRLAQEAVGERSVYIAGSVAPLEDCYSPHLTPPVSYCLREHRELIHNLEGVDLLLIETMNTVHEAAAAAQNAHAAGIPFVVSLVKRPICSAGNRFLRPWMPFGSGNQAR